MVKKPKYKTVLEINSDSEKQLIDLVGFIYHMKRNNINDIKLYNYNDEKRNYEQIRKERLRQYLILVYLNSRGSTTPQQIAEEFKQYSKSTIYKDLHKLESEERITVNKYSERHRLVSFKRFKMK